MRPKVELQLEASEALTTRVRDFRATSQHASETTIDQKPTDGPHRQSCSRMHIKVGADGQREFYPPGPQRCDDQVWERLVVDCQASARPTADPHAAGQTETVNTRKCPENIGDISLITNKYNLRGENNKLLIPKPASHYSSSWNERDWPWGLQALRLCATWIYYWHWHCGNGGPSKATCIT